MKLSQFIQLLETNFPVSLAADWDPVGLQVEPSKSPDVSTVMVSLDFTSAVVSEAIASKVDLLIAYHPPLFVAPERLIQSDAKARNLMRCIESGVAVYSPHTILDAIPGGVTDWLAAGLGAGTSSIIDPHPEYAGAGHGRLITLANDSDANSLASHIQSSLGIPWVRTALPMEGPKPIRSVAICPGAGNSAVENVDADAILTGEMRHHDILSAQEKGKTVFLCEHAASERGFLSVYAQRLSDLFSDDITVTQSAQDQGPLSKIILG